MQTRMGVVGPVTPFCQRRPEESITAWHRRIHETAHDWRDVAELLVLRGLHSEAKMVTGVAHLRREERTVALLGVAEERDREAILVTERAYPRLSSCGAGCVWGGPGPCACPAPVELHRLRQRAHALRWAAEALMRPEPRLMPPPIGEKDIVERFQDAIDSANRRLGSASETRTDEAPPSTERAAIQAEGRSITERMSERAGGPTASVLADVARVCLLDARAEPHEVEKRHLKKLADQMIERAGRLAMSAVTSTK